jgi:hypothetical protein
MKNEKYNLSENHVFTDDLRKENPALHLLYVEWACEHLRETKKFVDRMNRKFSNVNVNDLMLSLTLAVQQLIVEHADYHDANRFIQAFPVSEEYLFTETKALIAKNNRKNKNNK